MNALRKRPNWIVSNWKWAFPLFLVVAVFLYSLPKKVGIGALYVAKAYADAEVCDSALVLVKKNERVKSLLGELEPIGKLTILEGYVNYSENADSLFMAVTIKGTKGKGKMDVRAFQKDGQWEFNKLDVRLKESQFRKETIIVLP